jgi:hypothetical protein
MPSIIAPNLCDPELSSQLQQIPHAATDGALDPKESYPLRGEFSSEMKKFGGCLQTRPLKEMYKRKNNFRKTTSRAHGG